MSSTSIFSLIPTTSASSIPSPTRFPISSNPSASYLTTTTTSIIACLTPMIALMYLVVLSWTYTVAQKNPRPLNKTSGVRVQRFAPLVYVFLVLSSLSEVAIASWLILQYRFNHNYPHIETRTGARLLLFASSWTALTAGAYTLLFLHPTWSKHPISSIGAQAIWVFVTWLFWVVGAGIVNNSVPIMLDKGVCAGVAYCGQIKALFSVAILQSLTLTAGMVAMLWLAWQSTHLKYSLQPVAFTMK